MLKCKMAITTTIILVTAAHARAQTAQLKTPFVEEDFRAWAGAGPADLTGQAFLRTVGGDIKTCAGEMVFVMPDNAYNRELVELDRKGVKSANVDPRAVGYARATVCDAQGNFAFTNLPVGQWIVGTKVVWNVAYIEQPGERPGPLTSLLFGTRPAPLYEQQGGALRKAVSLVDGNNNLILGGESLVSR